VIAAQASRTALRVALHRAAHQLFDTPVFVDPLAVRILGPKVEAAFRESPAQYDTTRFAPQMRAFMAVRARFAEEQIAQARAAGVQQVVILGAGLDTYAYRAPAAPLSPSAGLTKLSLRASAQSANRGSHTSCRPSSSRRSRTAALRSRATWTRKSCCSATLPAAPSSHASGASHD